MQKKTVYRLTGYTFLILSIILFIFLIYWKYRPNDSHQLEELLIKTLCIVNNGYHNAFTDLIYWNEKFYLAYRESDYHAGSNESKIVIMVSGNAINWKLAAKLDGDGIDIRDPKFTIVKNKLFVFALKGAPFIASPTKSAYSFTSDGSNWSKFENINYSGWLIWRPRTADSTTWYAPFYWYELGESFLMKSTDCIHWQETGIIYKGDNTNETEITFLNDTTLIAVGRAVFSENYIDSPEGFTILSSSYYPFTKWTIHKKSFVTRLDGPNLFTYHGNVYAIGRYQPQSRGIVKYLGGIFKSKRTALFMIKNSDLIYLTDILSDGDTSYPGSVVIGDTLYFSYYTSDTNRDYPWVLGMFNPTSIRIGQVNLKILEKHANSE